MKTKEEIQIKLLAIMQILTDEYNKGDNRDDDIITEYMGEMNALQWVLRM